MVSVRIGVSVECCVILPVVCVVLRSFCPKVPRPVVKLAHGVWTQDYPIDRGKKKNVEIQNTEKLEIL